MSGVAVILGGRSGLLGQALTQAFNQGGWRAEPLSRTDVDPFDIEALEMVLQRLGCTLLVNTVAYTAVDKAEDEPAEATRLNADLPVMLGRLAARRGLRLLHFSTDFVFDGKAEAPYTPESPTHPLSVYGRTKLAGEQALLALAPAGLAIVRTSWLFGPGKTNFVHKILELAKTRPELGVVHDQIGSPTYTLDLARNCVALADAGGQGVFHLANAGRASWCELAAEAVAVAGLSCKVKPIATADYPLKARRPAYSVLDTARFTQLTGIRPRPWIHALRDYVLCDLSDHGHGNC